MRLLAVLMALSMPAFAQVEVEKPWSRATPPGAKVAAGYMLIRNKGASADRMVSATSPASGRVEMHVHIKEGEVLRMREVKGYDIPANGSFELKPGGAHLMFVDIKAPFKDGGKVPVALKFERAGEVKVDLPVRREAPAGGHHGH